jgi:N-acetylneuraminic acid mutarotase
MGFLTPKRVVLFVVAVLLGTSAFAKQPSPRTLARMAWDVPNNVGVLFGGRGNFDQATGLQHSSDETWLWNGARWLQRFPVTKPPARAAHSMVFDSTRNRVVMFGGRQEPANRDLTAAFLNDTWVWKDDNWTRIESAENPGPRHYAAMAYDSDRDVIVLYGGNEYAADGRTIVSGWETWEFDGSQWHFISDDAPKVAKPLLAYDAARKEMILLGLNDVGLTRLQYRYDTTQKTWVEYPSATTLPTCVNEGHLIYQEHRGRLAFFGGICVTATPTAEEVWEWDGANWAKITSSATGRIVGQASAYDPLRDSMVTFGGTAAGSAILGSITAVVRNGIWSSPFTSIKPAPRSLPTFTSDPDRNTIWMFGGLDEDSLFYYGDFWGYRAGQWYLSTLANNPGGGCETPLAAYDTDRKVLVVTCAGVSVYEWNGTEWKTFDPSTEPPFRNWAGMVYDQKLKKTIVFGGYLQSNYRNDTWAWNGTNWTEIRVDGDDRPPNRALMAMWYDPLQQKTILYGGLGRGNLNQKIQRYDDMWAFDGSRWTKLSVSTTPGTRFGPQYAVDPATGKLLLFGGLRSVQLDEDSLDQYFENDTWQWDGSASTWTRLEPTRRPDVRENGGMAWDPATGRLTLFAGYARGFYLSDVWTWNGQDWEPDVEAGVRRRAVR